MRNHLSLVPSSFYDHFFLWLSFRFCIVLLSFRYLFTFYFPRARFQLSKTLFKVPSLFRLLYFDFIIFNFNPVILQESAKSHANLRTSLEVREEKLINVLEELIQGQFLFHSTYFIFLTEPAVYVHAREISFSQPLND